MNLARLRPQSLEREQVDQVLQQLDPGIVGAVRSDALRRRPGAELDPFTADLLTNAATAALDTVSGEWLRSGGTADRAGLLDRAFTLIRPALSAR
jgi:hypothetical protein